MDANHKSTTFFMAFYASDPLDMVSVHGIQITAYLTIWKLTDWSQIA
jgi:hypothetical protein